MSEPMVKEAKGAGEDREQETVVLEQHASEEARGVPEFRPGLLSTTFFLWVLPLVWRAWRSGTLEPSDTPGLPPGKETAHRVDEKKEDGEEGVTDRIERDWAVYSAGGGGLFGFLLRRAKMDLTISVVWSLLAASLLCFLRPLLLKLFIEAFAEGDNARAVQLLVGVVSCTVVEGVSMGNVRHYFADRGGATYVGVSAHLLQGKALRLAPGAHGEMSPDALLGNDVSRTFDNMRFLGTVVFSVATLFFGLAAVTLTVGSAGIVGIVFLICGLATNSVVSVQTKKAEQRALSFADRRLSVLKRMLDGIKAIKFSVWEDDFMRLLKDARQEEVLAHRTYQFLTQSTVSLGRAAPILATVITFCTSAAMGGDVHAGEAFATLAVFDGLRTSLINLPLGIIYWSAFRVSLARIESFLKLPEFKRHPEAPVSGPFAVEMEKANFRWPLSETDEPKDTRQ
eukprot:Hpha_TRINITY_DN10068_c0_g1::TRINITY_DN10068_c0_g1_i1::g.83838::m.83838